MKKLILFVSAALLTLSCSSDDDSGRKASVEGTWKLTKFEITEEIDFNNDGTASKNLISETGCYSNSTMVFNDDNTVTQVMQRFDAVPQSTEDGGLDYNVTCNAATPSTGPYSVSENSVTVGSGSGAIALTRTGNKLTYSIPQIFSMVIEQDGELEEVELGAYLEFTKQ